MTIEPNLTPTPVVTCFLESEGKILLLRRSEQVSSYRGKWAGVSGYLEGEPDAQALTEIAEETGLQLKDISLVKKGKPVLIDDKDTGARWLVYPYLFHVKDSSKIKLDWEHRETRWVKTAEIKRYATVPGLKKALAMVYDSTD
ncbi:MAG TPA: NUDIX pyrophosphatase [Dehalococcoidales bacterium]